MPNAQNLVYRPTKSAARGLFDNPRDVLSTTDIAELAFARKRLLHGPRLEPSDYRLARRALELIADPMAGHTARGSSRPRQPQDEEAADEGAKTAGADTDPWPRS
jgi:hypothetical protein